MGLALAPSGPRAPLRRGSRVMRSRGRGSAVVQAMLGPFQYRTRVARLRQKGAQMQDFGERMLQPGSYGDDVMQLQAYLAEQGYINPADGLTGYFGDGTRDGLLAWQRDHGLRLTGVFCDEGKWAYLRQQEAGMKAAQTQALVAAVASAPPPLPVTLVQTQPGLATGMVGAAALAAGVVLAGPRLAGPDGLAAKAGKHLLWGAKWSANALLGMTVAASRVLYGAASGAVQGAVDAASPGAARRAAPSPVEAGLPRRHAASPLPQPDFDAVSPAELAARLAADEEDELAAAEEEEEAYLAALAASASASPKSVPKARRLSDDEVQQRIAVMKGELSPRAPAPQRAPAPRPIPLSQPKGADDPITGSKYGTYYGGRQVRDKVKQYLDGDTGRGVAAGRRMEAMNFQVNTRRPRPQKPAPPAQPAPPVMVAGAGPLAAEEAEPFRDVVDPIVVESEPQGLLVGTELEAAPERRGRPVPVVRPGMAVPLQLQPGSGAPQEATVAGPQAAPRPVPVVKPQKRATIGDMLRSAVRTNTSGGDPYAEPYSLANGGGGSYKAPLVTPPPQGPYQQLAPGGSSAGGGGGRPNGGSAYPVNTGSSYMAAAGGGGSPPAAEATPVQYNPDGSVVLASKPIKLVKPARLLPKTYGFEEMGVPMQGEPALPEHYGEPIYQMPSDHDTRQRAQHAQHDDSLDGYRRRSQY